MVDGRLLILQLRVDCVRKRDTVIIYTKGYEQQDIDEFIQQLQQCGVTLLVECTRNAHK